MLKMKRIVIIASVAAFLGAASHAFGAPFIYETGAELITATDLDGNGTDDLLLVDKASGKYRLANQESADLFNWLPFRQSGMKYVTGLGVGPVLSNNATAIFASADDSKLNAIELSLTAAGAPIPVPFTALGPSLAVVADIGGTGNTPAPDLYVGSIYNLDPENQITLLRNKEGNFAEIGSSPAPSKPVRGNAVTLKPGGAELVLVVLRAETADTFQVQNLAGGQVQNLASLSDLPAGVDYVLLGKTGGRDLLFYVPGKSELIFHSFEQAPSGAVQFGPRKTYPLSQAVKQIVPLTEPFRFLAIHGDGTSAAIYQFDGSAAPALVENVTLKEGETVFAGVAYKTGFVLFQAPPPSKLATKYQVFPVREGKCAPGAYGSLPTLEDSDEWTVAEIRRRVLETQKEKSQADMRIYTNIIPGASAKYVMVPVPGGEFVMGSPENEAGRNPDEGPQHKIKVEPFWMGRCEVTWDEYEIFVYLEDEKKMRQTFPVDESISRVSDAVSRPSRPYAEMSFGMGKQGFPAISMTQRAAAKYCQWLSAKTGHFYRLPTEAEWEYACRAGTSTAYFFGDDPAKLGDYAWYGMNSDFKYQKVGRKKPNAWGLHDMHGNVAEWCLDQYDPKFYEKFAGTTALLPWNISSNRFPHAVRGGHWDLEDPLGLRSAVRLPSHPDWQAKDPQLPRSRWWLTDAQFVGFRIIRPLKTPSEEEMANAWTTLVEK